MIKAITDASLDPICPLSLSLRGFREGGQGCVGTELAWGSPTHLQKRKGWAGKCCQWGPLAFPVTPHLSEVSPGPHGGQWNVEPNLEGSRPPAPCSRSWVKKGTSLTSASLPPSGWATKAHGTLTMSLDCLGFSSLVCEGGMDSQACPYEMVCCED